MADELMKRPSCSDEFVRRRAAELALPRIKGWMGSEGESDDSLIRDLMRGLTASDGYENAKSFEQIGWCVDSQLVEILDNDYLHDARKEMVKQWVKCLDIKLDLPIGTSASYRGAQGVIVHHDVDTAEYGISMPDMKPNQWRVCAAEDVTTIAAEQAA